jgi:hypothetical protein
MLEKEKNVDKPKEESEIIPKKSVSKKKDELLSENIKNAIEFLQINQKLFIGGKN